MRQVKIVVTDSESKSTYQASKFVIDAGDADKMNGSFVMKLHDFRDMCHSFDPFNDSFTVDVAAATKFSGCMMTAFACDDMTDITVKYVHVIGASDFPSPRDVGFSSYDVEDAYKRQFDASKHEGNV